MDNSKRSKESKSNYRVNILEGCTVKVVLLGPPNTGKSTLFNVLTGGKVLVANWPGVTVDVEIGRIKTPGETVCIADLPGTYSLYPTTLEEKIAEAFILDNKPDWIAVLIDATTPEKSLNLLLQAVEAFGSRVIGILTKKAVMHGLGIHIDIEGLKRELGVKIIETSALEGIGLDELKEAISVKPPEKKLSAHLRISYGPLDAYIGTLEEDPNLMAFSEKYSLSQRYTAISLLMNDPVVLDRVTADELKSRVQELKTEASKAFSSGLNQIIFEKRYQFVDQLASKHIVRTRESVIMDKIDRLLTHPVFGPINSLLLIFTVFLAVFSVNTGFPLNVILDYVGYHSAAALVEEYSLTSILGEFFDYLATSVYNYIGGQPGDLLGNGIIGGVGAVLSFVPLILMVYFFLGILEDTGVISRIASSLHPFLEPFGLTGRSVFPLFISLGCNVPGVYATRASSIEERVKSLWAVPFIPCQARLVVMLAFADAFFHDPITKTLAVLGLYTAGVIAALLTSVVASIFFREKLGVERRTPLVLELPYLHKPSWKVVYWITRDNTLHFIKKAGTVIFIMSIITWGLVNYGPQGYTGSIRGSFGELIGEKLSFILHPMQIRGVDANILTLSLVVGLVAKEVVLSTIVQATGIGDPIKAVASLSITHAQAFGFLLIVTLYFPCIATLAAMYTETRKWSYILLFAVYSVVLALSAGYIGYLLNIII
ncbi:MAG: ferrous iron transport protein B [Desulfurococcales archaeon]|nr:ferrous iron transport protein B [Desulfurococcales archaeon]